MSNCQRGKASPDTHTKYRLFADAAGLCQNPSCLTNLFLSIGKKRLHIAEIAHVFSASDIGPRADSKLSEEKRGDYSNLILLCPNCHTIVDKAVDEHPDKLIREWKSSHQNRIMELFKIVVYKSREEVKEAINPLLIENKTIFDVYGPVGENTQNPEDPNPEIWLRKIKERILPNNRKLLKIIDVNNALLDKDENSIVELFRQHVQDFEAKHLEGIQTNGIQFPSKLNSVFK